VEVFFVIICVIIILSSIVAIISPRTAWYLQEGWQYKDVEPSDLALIVVRIGGVVGVVGGIVLMVMVLNMMQNRPAGSPW
jgi:hypothetical protein